jgi:hypothetical protein
VICVPKAARCSSWRVWRGQSSVHRVPCNFRALLLDATGKFQLCAPPRTMIHVHLVLRPAKEMASSPPTVQSFDTVYPADSVEFCPISDYSDYFVCGTYFLQTDEPASNALPVQKGAQTRIGKCWLFKSENLGTLYARTTTLYGIATHED